MAKCDIGCLLCDQNINDIDTAFLVPCSICGTPTTILRPLQTPPYMCETCEEHETYTFVTDALLGNAALDPVTIMLDIVHERAVNICSNNFLYLTCGALLSSYLKTSNSTNLPRMLTLAKERIFALPRSACSLWSSYGIAQAAAIFGTLIAPHHENKSDPHSVSQHIVLKGLTSIATSYYRHGGPRCCRRNAFVILLSTITFLRKHFDYPMAYPTNITCSFSNTSRSCGQPQCAFYPTSQVNQQEPLHTLTVQDFIL